MKALVLNQFGEAHQFILKDIPTPAIGKGQVLLHIKAIGVNPVDTKVRNGSNRIAKNMDLPAVIGWDASGVVVACGEGVKDYKKGDEVFGCIGFPGAGGAYAEYAVADEQEITLKPEELSFGEAAAIPIVGLTAYQSIFEHLHIQSGEQLLIQAAAGGVGHLALQFAKIKGAKVLTTASAKNEDFLKELGADRFINYKTEKFEDYAKDIDKVQDAMGGEILHRSIGCVKKGGKIVCLPSSSKNDPEAIRLAKEKEIDLEWMTMYINRDHLKQIAEWIAEGKVKINIDRVFPFEKMAEAHEAIETHSTRGKIIVKGIN